MSVFQEEVDYILGLVRESFVAAGLVPVISRVSRSEGILRAHGYDSGVAYSVRVRGRR